MPAVEKGRERGQVEGSTTGTYGYCPVCPGLMAVVVGLSLTGTVELNMRQSFRADY